MENLAPKRMAHCHMGDSQDHYAESKKPDPKENSVWFYLYEVLKEIKHGEKKTRSMIASEDGRRAGRN